MKKMLSGLLVIIMLFGGLAVYAEGGNEKTLFSDLSAEHWAYSCIAQLAEVGIINGYEDGSFKPEKTVTRAEWAKMLYVAGNIPEPEFLHLSLENAYDLDTHDWCAKYMVGVQKYLSSEWIDENLYFYPNREATREEAASSAAHMNGYYSTDPTTVVRFNDMGNNGNGYIIGAVKGGLIKGYEDGTFKPNGSLTRAEAAAMLFRAFGYEKKEENEYSKYIGNYSVTNNIGTRSETSLVLNIYNIDDEGVDFAYTLIPPRHIITMSIEKGYFVSENKIEAKGIYNIDGQVYDVVYELTLNENSVDAKYTLIKDGKEDGGWETVSFNLE